MEGLLEMRSRRMLYCIKHQRSQDEDRLSGKVGSSGQTAETGSRMVLSDGPSLGKYTMNMVQ